MPVRLGIEFPNPKPDKPDPDKPEPEKLDPCAPLNTAVCDKNQDTNFKFKLWVYGLEGDFRAMNLGLY